jgi:hypothetical protein
VLGRRIIYGPPKADRHFVFSSAQALRVEFPGALYHLTSRDDGRNDTESLTCNGPVYTYIPMTYCLLALNENQVRYFPKIHSVLALFNILTVRSLNFTGTSLGNRKPRSSIRR